MWGISKITKSHHFALCLVCVAYEICPFLIAQACRGAITNKNLLWAEGERGEGGEGEKGREGGNEKKN